MNATVTIQVISLAILVVVVQIFVPVINISGLDITPDILIIFLSYIGYYYGRLGAIIMGFLF